MSDLKSQKRKLNSTNENKKEMHNFTEENYKLVYVKKERMGINGLNFGVKGNNTAKNNKENNSILSKREKNYTTEFNLDNIKKKEVSTIKGKKNKMLIKNINLGRDKSNLQNSSKVYNNKKKEFSKNSLCISNSNVNEQKINYPKNLHLKNLKTSSIYIKQNTHRIKYKPPPSTTTNISKVNNYNTTNTVIINLTNGSETASSQNQNAQKQTKIICKKINCINWNKLSNCSYEKSGGKNDNLIHINK